ncbi:hypothetical protein D3C85_1608000 [compost metagenome]
MRFSEQRAFGAVDAVRRHQEILQRAIAVFKHHIPGVRFDLRARRGLAVVQLIRQTLVENDMAQRVRIAGLHPQPAASGEDNDSRNEGNDLLHNAFPVFVRGERVTQYHDK